MPIKDNFYVVDFQFIDDYRCLRPLIESVQNPHSELPIGPEERQRERELRAELELHFTAAGWEGDGEINCIFMPPCFVGGGTMMVGARSFTTSSRATMEHLGSQFQTGWKCRFPKVCFTQKRPNTYALERRPAVSLLLRYFCKQFRREFQSLAFLLYGHLISERTEVFHG